MSAMSASNRFARAFSLRDKARAGSKQSNLNYGGVFSIEDGKRKVTKDEEKKIQEIQLHFTQLGKTDIQEGRIVYALRAKSAQGNVQEAQRLLMLFEDSVAGVLRPYNPSIKILGAENREKTTCYLDALLFAMFMKSDVFEAVLFNTYDDEQKRTLVTILRLWVNLLRTGKLIPVDITQHLQAAIASCGWPEAAKIRQQDASEAFNFLTDKLQLPLLTLKTDIYHAGEKDASDDHKFITERMLDVAIPDNVPSDQVLTLESCLEEYFNNRVEVKRHLQRRNTANSVTSVESEEKAAGVQVETVEVDSRTSSPAPSENNVKRNSLKRPLHTRARATSIFSERKVTVSDQNSSVSNGLPSGNQPNTTKKARKEVLMPAWQFLNLIPWYTDNVPENEPQVRSHFSHKRLMLGICLKRYGVTSNGNPFRKNAHIDIPLELASPHFTTGNELDGEGTVARDFKLSLKSVVCHRGHSVDAGHYIALVRADTPVVDRHEAFADPAAAQKHDASHDTWFRFDDLASERVTTVDIKKALKTESPYLLFYSVESVSEDRPEENPPPYQESEASLDMVDQKLSYLGQESRDSVEIKGGSISERESLDVASPDDSRRLSLSSLRGRSMQHGSGSASIKTDQLTTEPTTPLEETKTLSNGISRQTTKSKTDARQSSETDVSTKFGSSMSKLAARLSRDKLNNPDIIIDEIVDDTSPPKSTNVELSDVSKSNKPKEKKKKFMPITKSRRGSLGADQEKPERECALM